QRGIRFTAIKEMDGNIVGLFHNVSIGHNNSGLTVDNKARSRTAYNALLRFRRIIWRSKEKAKGIILSKGRGAKWKTIKGGANLDFFCPFGGNAHNGRLILFK